MQHFQRHDLSKVLVNTLLPLYAYKTNRYTTHKATVYHTTETHYTPTQTRKLDLCTAPSTLQTVSPEEFVVKRGERRGPHQLCKTQQMYGAIPAALFYSDTRSCCWKRGKQLGLRASSFWTQVTQKRKKFTSERLV